MKTFITTALAAFALVVITISCKKQYTTPTVIPPVVERNIHFRLYTNANFSTDIHPIKFSLLVRNNTRTLFDSALAGVLVKNIPDALHKLEFYKTIRDTANNVLVAGFTCEIEHVGVSWHPGGGFTNALYFCYPISLLPFDFTSHVSPLTFHLSLFTFHLSRFTFHLSRFTSHASHFTSHVSLFTFHF